MPDHKVICHLLLSAIISCYPVSVRYLCVYCLLRIDEKYSLCVIYTFFTELLGLVYSFYVYFMGSDPSSCCKKAGVSKIAFRGFHSLRRSFETVMVSRGVPLETVSQMMGHKSIIEDKPYITHDTHQISFVAMDFSDVPITNGFHFGHTESAGSLEGGAGA